LCTSFFRSIVHLQAYSLLVLCFWSGVSSEPTDAAGRPDAAPVKHLESIVCKDRTTGIEFPPLGICFDVLGDLYVVDSDNSRIYVADGSMDALTLFSECPPGYPECDFIDLAGNKAGGIYVSERSDGSIFELDRWGELRAYVDVGEEVAGIGKGKAGRVFAAMSIYGSVRMVDFDIRTEALETTIIHDDVNACPVDCYVLEDGTVIVTDAFSRQVFFLSGLGEIRGVARGFGFKSPFGVTCIGDRLILVADFEQGLVAVFDLKGDFLYSFGDGILDMPTFLDSTADGLVCVSDAGKMTIEVFRIGESSTE